MKVLFKPTQFIDSRKYGSQLELNQIYEGEICKDHKKVYFTDQANVEWVFFVGETCKVLSIYHTILHPESQLPVKIENLEDSITIAQDYIDTGEDQHFWGDILSQLHTIKSYLN